MPRSAEKSKDLATICQDLVEVGREEGGGWRGGGRGARGRWSMGQSRRRDGGRRGAGTATVSQFGDGGCLGDEQGGSPGRRARAAGACERRGGGFWTRRWRRQPVRGEGRRGPVRGGGCGINLLKFPSGRTLYIAWTVA
jgi:hypothetical protein